MRYRGFHRLIGSSWLNSFRRSRTIRPNTNWLSIKNHPDWLDASGSTTLRVTSATLSSIAVIPSIPVGATQQFVAIGTNSDGSTQDITQAVSWTSTNTPVATINGSGQATAIAAGAAVLIATTQSNFFPYLPVNISGATTLLVTP